MTKKLNRIFMKYQLILFKEKNYKYYRDLNGVFIQHEITGLRSKSYETLDDIPEAEKDIVKRISRQSGLGFHI